MGKPKPAPRPALIPEPPPEPPARLRGREGRGLVINFTYTLYPDQVNYIVSRALKKAEAEVGERIGRRVVTSASAVLRSIIDEEMERRPL